MTHREKKYFRAMWISLIIGSLLIVFLSTDSNGAEPKYAPIPGKVHALVEDDVNWVRADIIIPDGHVHSFFVEKIWNIRVHDRALIEFDVDNIGGVTIVVPYVTFTLNSGTKLVPHQKKP